MFTPKTEDALSSWNRKLVESANAFSMLGIKYCSKMSTYTSELIVRDTIHNFPTSWDVMQLHIINECWHLVSILRQSSLNSSAQRFQGDPQLLGKREIRHWRLHRLPIIRNPAFMFLAPLKTTFLMLLSHIWLRFGFAEVISFVI